MFKVHALSLCEEFLVCASTTECQAVQLNLFPNIRSEIGIEEKERFGSDKSVELSVDEITYLADSRHYSGQNANVTTETGSDNSLQKRNATAADQSAKFDRTAQFSVNNLDYGSSQCSRGSHFSNEAKLQQEFIHTDLSLSQAQNECDELFVGPVIGSQAPCPVSVEFEGIALPVLCVAVNRLISLTT